MKITGLLNIDTKYIEIEIGYRKDIKSTQITGLVTYPFIGIGFQIWKLVFDININYVTAGKDLLKYLNNLVKK